MEEEEEEMQGQKEQQKRKWKGKKNVPIYEFITTYACNVTKEFADILPVC